MTLTGTLGPVALPLSGAGDLTFTNNVTFTQNLTVTGDFTFGDATTDALQITGTLTVGVDGTGGDVKFFGDTNLKFMVWDESADDLILADAVALQLGGSESVADGFKIEFDGTDTLAIDAITADDGVVVGGNVSTDFTLTSAGGTVILDATGDTLTLSGVSLVADAAVGITTDTALTLVPVRFTAANEIIAEGAEGAISVATYLTTIGADAGGDAFTMAAGTVVGQLKRIQFVSTSGGTGVVTAATIRGADNTLTFVNAGEYAEFIWDGTNWLDIELSSTDDTNIATPPVISTV